MNRDKHFDCAFVCSPYRPKSSDPVEALAEIAANTERAQKACRLLTKLGYLPLAPHLYFTSFLQDEDAGEREDGILMGLKWLEMASELFCFGDEITEGMSIEIARAKELGIPVKMLPEPDVLVQELINRLQENSESRERED